LFEGVATETGKSTSLDIVILLETRAGA
jgi:hypothetical protein